MLGLRLWLTFSEALVVTSEKNITLSETKKPPGVGGFFCFFQWLSHHVLFNFSTDIFAKANNRPFSSMCPLPVLAGLPNPARVQLLPDT